MKTEEKIAFAEKRIEELQLLINSWKIHTKESSDSKPFEIISKNLTNNDLSLAA